MGIEGILGYKKILFKVAKTVSSRFSWPFSKLSNSRILTLCWKKLGSSLLPSMGLQNQTPVSDWTAKTYFPKALLPSTIPWGPELQHVNWARGNTQCLIHGRALETGALRETELNGRRMGLWASGTRGCLRTAHKAGTLALSLSKAGQLRQVTNCAPPQLPPLKWGLNHSATGFY